MATATVKLIFIELLCNSYQLTHSQVNNPSYTSTAVETYQLDVESTALVSWPHYQASPPKRLCWLNENLLLSYGPLLLVQD